MRSGCWCRIAASTRSRLVMPASTGRRSGAASRRRASDGAAGVVAVPVGADGSAYSCVTGAPPTITFTRPAQPRLARARRRSRASTIIVVVSSAEMADHVGARARRLDELAGRHVHAEIDPRRTRRRGASWPPGSCRCRAGRPTPCRWRFVPPRSAWSASAGSSTSIAAFIARAATSSSGTKNSPASNSRPASSMAAISPSSSRAPRPADAAREPVVHQARGAGGVAVEHALRRRRSRSAVSAMMLRPDRRCRQRGNARGGACLRWLPVEVHRDAQREERQAGPGLRRALHQRHRDEPRRHRDEEQRRRSGRAARGDEPLGVRVPAPEHEHAGGRQAEEDPVGEHDVGDQVLERAPEQDQDDRPQRLRDDRERRRVEARVDFGHPLEEEPVVGHREVDARRRQRVDADDAERRDEDGERDGRAARRCRARATRRRPPRAGDAAISCGRQQEHVGHVHQEVDQRDGRGADDHRERERAARVLDLGRRVGGVLPAARGPQHADHRGREPAAQPAGDVAERRARTSWCGWTRTTNPTRDQRGDAGDLQDREDVREDRAGLDAEHVDRRQQQQAGDGHELGAGRAERHEVAEVGGEGDAQRAEAARVADEEIRPAEQEADQAAVRLGEVDVLAARARHERRQFREGERAGHAPSGRRPARPPMISHGEGRARAISDGVRKMPDPIVPPIAIIVMSNRVRLRRSSAMVADKLSHSATGTPGLCRCGRCRLRVRAPMAPMSIGLLPPTSARIPLAVLGPWPLVRPGQDAAAVPRSKPRRRG